MLLTDINVHYNGEFCIVEYYQDEVGIIQLYVSSFCTYSQFSARQTYYSIKTHKKITSFTSLYPIQASAIK